MCQNQTSLVLRVELFSDKKVILDKGKKRFLLITIIKLASVTKCNLRNWNNFLNIRTVHYLGSKVVFFFAGYLIKKKINLNLKNSSLDKKL